MEVIESVKLKNLPQDIKIVEAQLSSCYGEFVSRNQDVNLIEVEVIFKGGTPQKEIKREVK